MISVKASNNFVVVFHVNWISLFSTHSGKIILSNHHSCTISFSFQSIFNVNVLHHVFVQNSTSINEFLRLTQASFLGIRIYSVGLYAQ